MVHVSGFVIVQNGERTLERSLASLARVCDEIIVVDTGSTDATKEIAARFTGVDGSAVQIFDFVWIDDFSAARNFALEKCGGEWIIYLDADDEMSEESCATLQKILQKNSDDIPGYSIPYQYSSERILYVPRIFRRELGLRFMMPIHEFLNIPAGIQKRWRVCGEVLVTHLKKSEDNTSSLTRNVAILSKALERESDSADINSLNHLRFFLARDLYAMAKYNEALPYFNALVEAGVAELKSSFLYLIQLHRGRCLQYLKRYDEAIDAYQKTFEADNRFNEPLIYQADILLYQKHDSVRAHELYKKACDVPLPQSSFPVEVSFYHEYPVTQLKKISRLDKPLMLVCGYYGKMNFGDELILESIIQHFPNHRIVVASYDVGLTQALHEIESVPYGSTGFDQALSLASCVIIGGGGLFHDQGLLENKTISLYCEIIRKVSTAKKKVFLVGVGVDTIVLPENQRIITETFFLCDGVFVRDDASKEHLLACGVSDDSVHVVPDLVFDLDIAALSESVNAEQETEAGTKTGSGARVTLTPRIGLNLCLPVYNSKVDLLSHVDTVLIPFLKKYSGIHEFVFIPFALGDRDYIAYLEEKTGVKLSVFTFTASTRKAYFEQYIYALSQCDTLIGSRYHFLLMGMLLGKPTYGLSYSEKTSSLIQLFSPHISQFNGEISITSPAKIILEPLQLSIRDMVAYIEKKLA